MPIPNRLALSEIHTASGIQVTVSVYYNHSYYAQSASVNLQHEQDESQSHF